MSMHNISSYFKSDRNGVNQSDELIARLEMMENCLKDMQTNIKEIRSECINRIEAVEEAVIGNVGEESRKNILKFLRRFASSSTLHGVPNIASASQMWVRVFWSIVLIGAVGLLSWQFVGLFMEFYQYPVITEVTIHNSAPPLPQVVVCNYNAYSRTKVLNHPSLSNHSFLTLSKNDSKYNDLYFDFLDKLYALPEEQLRKLSHGKNLVRFYGKYKEYHLSDKDVSFTRQTGNCYRLEMQPEENVVQIFVNVSVDDYIFKGHIMGAKIFISDRDTYPFLHEENVLESVPGKNLVIDLNLEVINRLNGSYNHCQNNEEEFRQRTGLNYEQHLCMEECRIKHTVDLCGCFLHSLEKFSSIYNISYLYRHKECNNKTEYTCVKNEYALNASGSGCKCNAECHTKIFLVKKDSFPSTKLTDVVYCESLNMTCTPKNLDWIRKNIAASFIRFSSLRYKEYTQKPLYSFSRFVSDLGGTLGLFTGASLLTVTEIVQLLIGILLFLF